MPETPEIPEELPLAKVNARWGGEGLGTGQEVRQRAEGPTHKPDSNDKKCHLE